MQISFTGRQMEIPDMLRQYTERRLRKLSKIVRDGAGTDAHVILTAEKHRRTAEITLKIRDHTLVGIEETADARSSIDGAVTKLKRQAVRYFQRKWTRKRRPKPTAAVTLNVLRSQRVDHEEVQALEAETIPLRLLTVDEAVRDQELRRRGIIVFRNTETDRVNVIYHRQDGNLTLIEPES